MKAIRWVGAALLALVSPLALGANAGAADANAATQARPDMSETDMSHTGRTPEGTATVPWNLLGGAVGARTVNGVRVELYVLQAQDTGALRPGDPNHAFTVTLKDDKSSEFLKQGDVSIAVAGGAGPAQHSEMSTRSSGIFRSGVTLPQPGEYRVTIAFKAAGRTGQVDFPYQVRPAAQHQHPAMPAAAASTRTERVYFVPDVVLKDIDGKTVALRPLTETNQPVMLDFIYTSCTAICPLLSETFVQVQHQLGVDAAGLRMISISIDPEYDTPKVLRAYAQTYHPGPQWHFLTGSPKDIREVQQAFDAYRANKMDHAAIVFLRSSQGKPWIRFDGLVDPATLVHEFRQMPLRSSPAVEPAAR